MVEMDLMQVVLKSRREDKTDQNWKATINHFYLRPDQTDQTTGVKTTLYD